MVAGGGVLLDCAARGYPSHSHIGVVGLVVQRLDVMVNPLLPRLDDKEVLPLSGASLWRRWRLGIVAVLGAMVSACGLDGLERDDDDLPLLRPDSLDSGAVRLRFLMTSVLRLSGRTTPCSL